MKMEKVFLRNISINIFLNIIETLSSCGYDRDIDYICILEVAHLSDSKGTTSLTLYNDNILKNPKVRELLLEYII